MASVFNQLLAGLSGGAQGYARDEDRKLQQARQATNDGYLNDERASQVALRKAQAGQATQKQQQDAYLRTPEFQTLYQQARGGDEGAIAKVASAVAGHPDATTYLNSLTRETKPVAQGHVVDPVTGDVKFFDPTKPPSGLRVHPAPVPQSFTPVTLGGADGAPPVIKAFNSKTGQVGPVIGDAKPTTTRIESATNTAAKARLEAAVSEMNNAHGGMADYEAKLANGTANINGIEQWGGRVANAFTHDDPVSMSIQSAALATLNRSNPELARYIRRGLSFAEGESMISQRPSDFRTKMSAFLSTAGSGAHPEMINDIQSRRTSILNPLNQNVKGSAGQSTGNVNLGTPHVSATERAALKAQGFSDAQIDAYKP